VDAPVTGWFGKTVAVVAAVIFLAAALVFSLVLVAVLLAVGVVFGGYLWWKTRALRRQVREQVAEMQARAAAAQDPAGQAARAPSAAQGEVIDGEFTRVGGAEDERAATGRRDTQ
jgi:uncharacterized protein HemX